jgi:uncharacterized protein (TIGR02466 family)
MNIIDLYTVPLFHTQLTGSEQITRQEVEVLKNIKLNKQYGEDGNHLSEDIHILQKYRLDRLKNLCDSYVSNYTQNILGITNEFKMFKSWLSMNVKGTRHDPHSHRNTMISCILYFDEHLSDEVLDPINFEQSGLNSTFKKFQFQFNIKEPNQYNNQVLSIYPKTNTLLIFPGWVRHEVPPVVSDTKRYCLGTNYFFTGETGVGYHNLTVKID